MLQIPEVVVKKFLQGRGRHMLRLVGNELLPVLIAVQNVLVRGFTYAFGTNRQSKSLAQAMHHPSQSNTTEAMM